MKQDEIDFLIQVFQRCRRDSPDRTTPRKIIESDAFTMPHKRAWYLLDKWSDRNLYDYGVTIDLGWLTEQGEQLAAQELSKQQKMNNL